MFLATCSFYPQQLYLYYFTLLLYISQDSLDYSAVIKTSKSQGLKTARVYCFLTPHVRCVSWEVQLREPAYGSATYAALSWSLWQRGTQVTLAQNTAAAVPITSTDGGNKAYQYYSPWQGDRWLLWFASHSSFLEGGSKSTRQMTH